MVGIALMEAGLDRGNLSSKVIEEGESPTKLSAEPNPMLCLLSNVSFTSATFTAIDRCGPFF